MDYGAVMGKSLNLALLLTVSLPAVAYAVSAGSAEKAPATASSGIYKLDEEKAASAAVSKAAGDAGAVSPAASIAEEETDQPKIIKEEISGGHIEKLVAPDGKVIAEKTIKDGEVVKKVLNYYHPNGQVSRKVTTLDDGKGFYAEDYYMNGRLAAQATYLNENNKIGTEKKYDNNGTLRQEIPWVLPKEDTQKPLAEQKTIRQGNIITYYPDGRIAASFPVGQEDGKTLFFNRQGRVIKEVENARVLNFAPELDTADCQDKVVKLSLEELVELYEDEGDISYNKCGLPYRENFVYEIADMRGNAVSKISYDDTGMIRRITPYVGGLKNGVEQKFDASGNLTAEINYKQGIKNGTASGFFPTKEVAFRKRYEDGKVVGRLTCYFPTGEVAAEFAYKDGKKEGTAKIYGPNAREISFASGEIVGAAPKDARRAPEPSKLAALSNPDPKCLDITSKLDELELDLEANANTVTKAFTLNLPDSCRDFSSFKPEKSNYACYDALNRLRAVFPTGYNRGEYAIETVYAENGQHLYDIPYYQKQKQGFAKKFDDKGQVVSEIYYSRNELAESSRSYHDNGAVKEMLTIADGAPRKLLVRYNKDGTLAFSLNYNEGEKTDAFLAEPQKNKDVYLKFYEGELDNIREVNASNPQNYIEYNLASGEYTVYKNSELIKGGKICGYENRTADAAALSTNDTPSTNAAPSTAAPLSTAAASATDTVAPLTAAASATAGVSAVSSVTSGQSESVLQPAPKQALETPASAVEVPAPVAGTPVAAVPASSSATSASDAAPSTVDTVSSAPVAVPASEEVQAAASSVQKADIPARSEKDEVSPVLPADAAPMVEGLDPVSFDDIKLKNAIIPTAEEKKQAELAAKNIGPVAKPDIDALADVVAQEHVSSGGEKASGSLAKTEKFYYPNGNLRKTIKTRGGRTEEIKEYSKTGLLLTDTVYKDDGILIEKYFGSGEIRRKTNKAYTDNPVMAFVSREDFYDNGKARYEITRKPETLLFSDKQFYPDGTLKVETVQNSPLSYTIREYDKAGKLAKVIKQFGPNVLEEVYDASGTIKSLKLNGADMPVKFAGNSTGLLRDNMKIFAKNGAVSSEFKADEKQNSLLEYYKNGKVKAEIVFYNNGEISVKAFGREGALEKFAYLAPDGKLHLQKPSVRTVSAYRERHWVDYNNPRWIENQDRYSVKSVARLNLDTAAYILAELDMQAPEMMKKLYDIYK